MDYLKPQNDFRSVIYVYNFKHTYGQKCTINVLKCVFKALIVFVFAAEISHSPSVSSKPSVTHLSSYENELTLSLLSVVDFVINVVCL